MNTVVEVWLAKFDGALPQHWVDCLDAEERTRAGLFGRPEDATAFVGRRAMLRHLLGARLGRRPHALRFGVGPHGKPFVQPAGTRPGPFFSVSRTGGFALVALCDTGEIGADLERLQPTGIEAAALFTARERAHLARRSGYDALRAFYRYWVCKEAVIKALGQGFTLPLDAIEISPPDAAPTLLDDQAGRLPPICLELAYPAEDLIAAVATFVPVDIVVRSWSGYG